MKQIQILLTALISLQCYQTSAMDGVRRLGASGPSDRGLFSTTDLALLSTLPQKHVGL